MTYKSIIVIVLIAFVVGSIGSIFFDRVLIPYLATLPGLSDLRSLQTDSPLIINRREVTEIEEGVNLTELTKQAQSFIVSIYAGSGADLRLLGSGIILTSDGLIFTSSGVVGSNVEVTVVANDGKVFPGVVRALDRKSEIAAVTVVGNNLGQAQFDDAEELLIGQRVVGLGKTTKEFTRLFASGMITRTVDNRINFEQVYSSEQTAESFDHSTGLGPDFIGGPIINSDGRVVGLVANGTGKMITSESLNQALNSYLQTGKIIRPYYGFEYQVLSETVASLRNLSEPGALITMIKDDSPAKKAGLLPGDYVTAVDGTGLDSMSFERLINRHQPGNVRFTVARSGTKIELNFSVENR
jgi:S1-C subfamily serine protease